MTAQRQVNPVFPFTQVRSVALLLNNDCVRRQNLRLDLLSLRHGLKGKLQPCPEG